MFQCSWEHYMGRECSGVGGRKTGRNTGMIYISCYTRTPACLRPPQSVGPVILSPVGLSPSRAVAGPTRNPKHPHPTFLPKLPKLK